jgi:hypothetical protein
MLRIDDDVLDRTGAEVARQDQPEVLAVDAYVDLAQTGAGEVRVRPPVYAAADVPTLDPTALSTALPEIFLSGVVLSLMNIGLLSAFLALRGSEGIWRFFRRNLFPQCVAASLTLGLSPVIVVAGDFSLVALPLLFLPVLALNRHSRYEPPSPVPNFALSFERPTDAPRSDAA